MLSKNIKHNKIKNIGLLFELLVRQITSDALEDKKQSMSAQIIKEYFTKNSEIKKELDLYQKLIKSNFTSEAKASSYVDIIIEHHKGLNQSKLKREKYNIIKSILENYDKNNFFSSRIDNYPIYASIYKLFEYNTINESQYNNANDLIECKFKIVEHLTRKSIKQTAPQTKIADILSKENMSVRLLTQRIIIEDFNKYFSKKLNENQRSFIEDYINGITSTNSFMLSVKKRISEIVSDINKIIKIVNDIPIKIKLEELVVELSSIKDFKSLNDNQFIAILKSYELIEELKKNVKKYKCG